MSAPGRSTGVRGIGIALQVAKYGPRIDPEVTRCSSSIPAGPVEDFADVLSREVFAGLRERNDGALLIPAEIEVFGSDQRLVR
jgi:hypothetical protein